MKQLCVLPTVIPNDQTRTWCRNGVSKMENLKKGGLKSTPQSVYERESGSGRSSAYRTAFVFNPHVIATPVSYVIATPVSSFRRIVRNESQANSPEKYDSQLTT